MAGFTRPRVVQSNYVSTATIGFGWISLPSLAQFALAGLATNGVDFHRSPALADLLRCDTELASTCAETFWHRLTLRARFP
jgi:UDP-N-acetyl-D-mannosaminuronate dehydrogenase